MSPEGSTLLDVGVKVADTYELVRLIGRGGMGQVWLAGHLRLPGNVFLVPTLTGTQVKVLDFGSSKIVESTTLQTADEVLVGAPQYMSPEQAIGNNKHVGPQTDVFALGSIAYEMLSGAPPFVAD